MFLLSIRQFQYLEIRGASAHSCLQITTLSIIIILVKNFHCAPFCCNTHVSGIDVAKSELLSLHFHCQSQSSRGNR